MDMDIKLVTTEKGDWYGLYINNELKSEGHSIDSQNVVKLLAKTFNIRFHKSEISNEVFTRLGFYMPRYYDELN